MMMELEYRRRKGSDVWHYHRRCRWWPALTFHIIFRELKPTTGELCNECQSKERRSIPND